MITACVPWACHCILSKPEKVNSTAGFQSSCLSTPCWCWWRSPYRDCVWNYEPIPWLLWKSFRLCWCIPVLDFHGKLSVLYYFCGQRFLWKSLSSCLTLSSSTNKSKLLLLWECSLSRFGIAPSSCLEMFTFMVRVFSQWNNVHFYGSGHLGTPMKVG
jgi:hypothetical protein